MLRGSSSKFDYSNIVWDDKNNLKLMDHLQVLQYNAARPTPQQLKYYTHP